MGFGKVASPLSFGCAFGIRSGKEFLFEEKGLLPKMLPKWLSKESYQKSSEACSQISSEITQESQIQLIKFLNDENLSLLPQAKHFERSRKHSQKKGFFWWHLVSSAPLAAIARAGHAGARGEVPMPDTSRIATRPTNYGRPTVSTTPFSCHFPCSSSCCGQQKAE